MEDFIDYYKRNKPLNYTSHHYSNYTQIIDETDSRKNINWKFLKRENNFCTVSVAFYKKNFYSNQQEGGFKKYEDGLINFFISFIFLNYKNKFRYNIRFYINKNARNILHNITEKVIGYIKKNQIIHTSSHTNTQLQKSLNKLILMGREKKIDITKIYDYIEIFEYSFNIDYFEENNTSIGMFMRLLPLIDDRHLGLGLIHYCNRVLVCDIDSHFRNRRQKLLHLYIEENVQFGYTSRVGYEFSYHNKCDRDRNKYIYPIINLFIYQYNVAYPYQLFLEFYNENMNKLLTNFNEKNNGKIEYTPNIDYLKDCGVSKIFGYGHDEIFTNQYILKYYLARNIYIKSYLRNGYYSIFVQILYEVLQNIEKIKRNNLDIMINTKQINNKLKSILNIESLPFITEFQNFKNTSLDNIYKELKSVSVTSEIPQKFSKILLMSSWKPDIPQPLHENNSNKISFFYPHTELNSKIREFIQFLFINHNITLSNDLLRSIRINELIIPKYFYTRSNNRKYNEYINTVRESKNNNYYFYFLDINKHSISNFNLTRYICDGYKIIKEFPIIFNYKIDQNTGNIEEINYRFSRGYKKLSGEIPERFSASSGTINNRSRELNESVSASSGTKKNKYNLAFEKLGTR